jgi:hypothetical protein
MEYVRELTEIGPRLTGTAGGERAAEWAAEKLRAAGITHVVLEPFTIADGWERERASARIVTPAPRALHVAALGWTPSTPKDGIEAEIVALAPVLADRVATLPGVRGRIVLLTGREPGGSMANLASRRRAFDADLRRAGAIAMVSPEADHGAGIAARDRTPGAVVGALPAAQISRDDGALIKRLLEGGPVRLALDLQNRVTAGPVTVHNVVGEMRGREAADEYVIVGAHLDSWDFSPAAQDNATGVAGVIDAARAIAALNCPPRRSIRFVLWSGEEQGQLGSNAYVAAHRAEQDRWIAYLNSDAGSSRVIGWTAPGRHDVADAARRIVGPATGRLAPLAFDASTRYGFQSDGAPFIRAGVPTLDLNADDARYEEIHHTSADTVDRVDPANVQLAAAVAAATAYAIADAPARLAPRSRH